MTRCATKRRGLTLVELMISLAITAMIGAAIATMMATVSEGVGTRRDMRSLLLRGHSGHVRLSAVVDSSKSILSAADDMIVLWHDDNRSGGTIHATELRWIQFDAFTATCNVLRIEFPESWTEAERNRNDRVLTISDNFTTVLLFYQSRNWIATETIVDSVSAMRVQIDNMTPTIARVLTIDIDVEYEGSPRTLRSTHSLRFHEPPIS